MGNINWKKIAIGASAAFGVVCCMATSEVAEFSDNVSTVAYADTLSFSLDATESVTFKVTHTCDSSKMLDGEPISVLTSGRIEANLPEDAPEAGRLEVVFKNQNDEENPQTLDITPGVPAELFSGKDIVLTWNDGDSCNFNGWITLTHSTGGTITGTLAAQGELIYNNAPEGVDAETLNYAVSAEEEAN